MSRKNIFISIGAALSVMAAIAAVGWIVATEFGASRQAPADTKRPAFNETLRDAEQEIVVRDQVSAKLMLDALNQDMSSLERAGVE